MSTLSQASIISKTTANPVGMPPFSVSFLAPAEVEKSPDLLAAWENLLDHSDNLYRLYQSPEWWNHLCSLHQESQLSLGVVRDGRSAVVGIVPLQIGPRDVPFELGKQTLWRTRFNTVSVLGSQPLLPDDDGAYRQLIRSLWDSFSSCDSIYLKSVVRGSWCWRYFEATGPGGQEGCFPYAGEDVRPYHSITLAATFEEYLRKFSSKRRYVFRREIRVLEELGGGHLKLERIDRAEQVERFLGVARPLFDRSWKGKSQQSCLEGGKCDFEDLARRGVLRSYLLQCGEACCAYAVGYQFRGIFYLFEIAHDPDFNKYSPGKVLLLLLIEDLTRHASPQIVNLGHGDHEYKANFGTDHTEDATIVLMRRTFSNRFKCGCHQAFRFSLRTIKRCLGRRTRT